MKRILLDESVPRRLGFALEGHFVRTVQFMGWTGVKNGQLLRLAADQFEAFITADQNLRYQQHPELPLAVVTLAAANNRLQTLSPLIPDYCAHSKPLKPHVWSRSDQLPPELGMLFY